MRTLTVGVVVDLSQLRCAMPGTVLVRVVPVLSEPCSGRALCQSGQADEVVFGHYSAHIWLRPTPRYLNLRPPPTVFTQPNTSSTRLRTG